ncbi:sialate O-acetylesterase [Planctomycetota bacterium]
MYSRCFVLVSSCTSRRSVMKKAMLSLILVIIFSFTSGSLQAEVKTHNIFGQNMVLQRGKSIRVWGWADAGESVTVTYSGQTKKAKADDKGNWSVTLDTLKASTEPRELSIKGISNTITFNNVVVGDVWLCGGQSNMEDVLEEIYHGDTEVVSANHPNIRLITIPQVASPKAMENIDQLNEFNSWTGHHEMKGNWAQCTPQTVNRFSAIGYIFGRRLHLASGVPIGLIDASWGGTTIEAWTSRTKLATIPDSKGLTDEWDQRIAKYDSVASLKAEIEQWEKDSKQRKQHGEQPDPKPTEPEPDPVTDRNNPAASFNAMVAPIAGFNIKGVIFNQGYNNALDNARPRLYAGVFKAMIQDWRRAFRDESLSFGIIGLTAGGQPQTLENFELRMVDPGPFIREGQFKASQELENVCFMPAYDQQVPWYHPHKKFELGERIARWALNTQYGFDHIGWKLVVCTRSENKGDHFILTFDRAVQVDDGRAIEGFAIAGEDRHFVPASAEYVGEDEIGNERWDERLIKVWSPLVKKPVAVRYAWARNPLGNVVNSEHHERVIPIPSFRTDDWDWPEAPFRADGGDAEAKHRDKLEQMRRNAERWVKERMVLEAR